MRLLSVELEKLQRRFISLVADLAIFNTNMRQVADAIEALGSPRDDRGEGAPLPHSQAPEPHPGALPESNPGGACA